MSRSVRVLRLFACSAALVALPLIAIACGTGGVGELPKYDPGLGGQYPAPAVSDNPAGGPAPAPAPTFGPAPEGSGGDAASDGPGEGGDGGGDGGDAPGEAGEAGEAGDAGGESLDDAPGE